jgi:hydrogenase maturation protein HypF
LTDETQAGTRPETSLKREGREALPRRRGVLVRGVVQGVGFRPFVYRLAREEGLAGLIGNDTAGVTIEIEGPEERVEAFLARLRSEAPPLARIDAVAVRELPLVGDSGFRIVASEVLGRVSTGIPADAATCPDCLRELLDPKDRRYRYPFLNCTNCGPRFTITRSIPYDRPQTSMAKFPMCPACQREYDDPSNRRFHAQPNACPVCGPQVWLVGADGVEIGAEATVAAGDAVAACIDLLVAGQIVAIKGIGGFHLSVDATSQEAVMRLRERKRRYGKPLAVMVRDLEAARAVCELTAEEEALLTTPARPIVLARARAGNGIAAGVAPGIPWLGVFLPYAPLQHLLFAPSALTGAGVATGTEGPARTGLRTLVMTSANLSEEPIAIDNEEARKRLGGIADAFLMHDREILQRCDDSVAAVVDGRPQLIRRARGFVPLGVALPFDAPPLLAVGGHMKNVFALARGGFVYQSQHLGDLENLKGLEFFKESLEHLMRTFEIDPQTVVHDLHPGYLSTGWAKEWARERGLALVAVQHHHAHVAGCMAEHGLTGQTIGLALDGTGYGTDGKIWGGEVFLAGLGGADPEGTRLDGTGPDELSRTGRKLDGTKPGGTGQNGAGQREIHQNGASQAGTGAVSFERFAHLDYVPMPGGEAAIKEPWRMALGHLQATGFDLESAETLALIGAREREARVLARMIERGVNAPLTSSLGRLFDAAAAVVLGRRVVEYEAQAAIELEGVAVDEPYELAGPEFAGPDGGPGYGMEFLGGDWVRREPVRMSAAPLWRELVRDLRAGVSRARMAARFHAGVAAGFVRASVLARAATGVNRVALSGGCMHNRRLARLLRSGLEAEGFEVFQHLQVSPGDGGLSYGQIAVAAALARNGFKGDSSV